MEVEEDEQVFQPQYIDTGLENTPPEEQLPPPSPRQLSSGRTSWQSDEISGEERKKQFRQRRQERKKLLKMPKFMLSTFR